MRFKGLAKAVGLIVIAVLALVVVLWIALRAAAPDLVREQASSSGGYHAEVIVDGVPLSDGTRVLVWKPGWPHWQIFGCKVLETYHEQPIKLAWAGDQLHISHAYQRKQIVFSRTNCGAAHVTFLRSLKTYS